MEKGGGAPPPPLPGGGAGEEKGVPGLPPFPSSPALAPDGYLHTQYTAPTFAVINILSFDSSILTAVEISTETFRGSQIFSRFIMSHAVHTILPKCSDPVNIEPYHRPPPPPQFQKIITLQSVKQTFTSVYK